MRIHVHINNIINIYIYLFICLFIYLFIFTLTYKNYFLGVFHVAIGEAPNGGVFPLIPGGTPLRSAGKKAAKQPPQRLWAREMEQNGQWIGLVREI